MLFEMKNKDINIINYVIIMAFCFLVEHSFSQGYVLGYNENAAYICGPGDVPGPQAALYVVASGKMINGILVSENGGTSGNFVALTAQQLFCGHTFNPPLDTSSDCYSSDVTYVSIRPDNNFKILTPRPTVGNTVPSITLEATPGYHELVYNWMYFDIVSNSWEQFPSRFLGESSITFTAEDLFGNNASNYINKSIQYKLELCNGWSPMSSPYTYNLIYPSPELNGITTKKTSCSYTTDGGFKINVNRNLSTGETLVITLYDAANNALVGQEFTTTLTNNGNGSYGYTWQADLDPINYKLKYQTHNSNSGISPNDPTWDSLEFSQIFIIDKASKLILANPTLASETCFQENDGYINISATGESGRTFFYQLKENSVPQVFNGTNWTTFTGSNMDDSWIPFTNSNNSKINTLGKGNYSVQVRDSKKCYSK